MQLVALALRLFKKVLCRSQPGARALQQTEVCSRPQLLLRQTLVAGCQSLSRDPDDSLSQ